MNGPGIKVSLAGMMVATLASILLTPFDDATSPAFAGLFTWMVWATGSLAALAGLGIVLSQEGNPRLQRREATP